MSQLMDALVKPVAGPGLELRQVPIPEPGPGEGLIKIHKTAICGTDQAFSLGRPLSRPWFGFHRQIQRVPHAGGLCPPEKQRRCFFKLFDDIGGMAGPPGGSRAKFGLFSVFTNRPGRVTMLNNLNIHYI